MPVTIANPPEARPERISRLLTRVEQGDIKIPKFQRSFVWTPQQILDLLDSIYRGYPIGSLLLWRTSVKLAKERNVGGFELPETADQYPTNYILDGQQRITTIFAVLSGRPAHPDFNVHFDLQAKKFLHVTGEATQLQMPLSYLFDTMKFRTYQMFLNSLPEGAQFVEESDRVNETFREYAIPIVTVTEASAAQVSLIFERINSTGTKLTVFDLMVAATWSEDFDLNDHVDQTLMELEEKDFDGVDRVTLLRALAVCASGSAKRDAIIDLREMGRDKLLERMDATKEAIRRAVDFLSTDVYVMSDEFLPYERQLVLLTFIMSSLTSLSADAAVRLRRWFWLTSFSERYRRGGEGLFDDDLQVALMAVGDPMYLSHFAHVIGAADVAQAEFRKGSAFSNAFVALLAHQHPVNLTNGVAIDIRRALSSYNRKEFHHIFPQAFLRRQGYKAGQINVLPNICMLAADQNKAISDSSPREYFAEAKRRLGSNFDNVLRTNLISGEALDAIDRDDYSGFVLARSDSLVSAMDTLIN